MTHLKDIIDTNKFAQAVEKKLINSRPHMNDPLLRVFSYSKQVQFKRLWSPETRLARGLILQFASENDYETARVVGRGIPKFFTVEQLGFSLDSVKLIDDDENVTVDESPVIPWDEPAHVANKLNGALGLGYIAPSGVVSISTKGSFDSLEASIGTEIITRKIAGIEDDVKNFIENGKTPLFEIITPKRQHPVDYGDLEDLIYLGYISHEDGAFMPANENHFFVAFAKFTPAESMPYGSLREALNAPYIPNTEGMIVSVWENGEQHLFKIKPDEYFELRRLFYLVQTKDLSWFLSGLSDEEIASVKTAHDVKLGKAENAFSKNREHIVKARKEALYEKIREVQDIVLNSTRWIREVVNDSDNDRKKVALAIKGTNTPYSKVLFAAYRDLQEGTRTAYTVAMKEFLKTTEW